MRKGKSRNEPARRQDKVGGKRAPRRHPPAARRGLGDFCGASVLGLAVLGCGVVAGTGCAKVEPIAPFRPRALQMSERTAAIAVPPTPRIALPTTLPSAPTTRPAAGELAGPPSAGYEEPVIYLTLREVIQRAVMNNPDIRVAGYEPAIDETRVVEAEARFDPAFFATLQFQEEEFLSPTGGQVAGINPFSPSGFRQQQFRGGLRQLLETGGQAEISYGTSRIRRIGEFQEDPNNPIPNPYYVADLQLRVQQPLLRDFGAEVNRARITIARNNQRISLLEFRRTLEEQLADLEQAYWRLREAQRQVAIQEQLLDNSYETTRILKERLDAGADVNRAQLQLAAQATEGRRADLIRVRAQMRDLSDEVKRRMNDPDLPVSGNTLILPGSEPTTDQIVFNFAELLDTAYAYRFELAQQALRIDSAGIAQRVAEKNLLPRLDFALTATFQGPGEEIGNALGSQHGFDDRNYQWGLEFEIPLGNREARAVYRRAQLQRSQAIDQYRALVNTITQDVKVAERDVQTSYLEMAQRRKQVLTAADSLEALLERQRQGVEELTPAYIQTLLNTQENLASAQQQEAQAISNYNIAVSRLERAKGTLLRYDNVLMEEVPQAELGRRGAHARRLARELAPPPPPERVAPEDLPPPDAVPAQPADEMPVPQDVPPQEAPVQDATVQEPVVQEVPATEEPVRAPEPAPDAPAPGQQ